MAEGQYMFTFTDKKVGRRVTDEKCFNDLYDLYMYRNFKKKLVLVFENKIAYELPLKMISVKWAVACAERSLHIFEEKRPLDDRPRLAIEAAKRWIIDPRTDASSYYVQSMGAATGPAYAAAYTAASAGASDGDNAASYAAFAVAYADNTIAVYYANAGAIYNAAYSDQQNWSRNKLKEIVEEYLNNYRHLLKNTLKHLIIPELSDIIIKYVF